MSRIRELASRKPLAYVLAFGMWSLTAVIAVWEVLLVRAAAQRLLIRFFLGHGSPSELLATVRALPISNVVGLLMGVLALAILIGGFDFYFEQAGKRRSWVIFSWTLGIQLALLAFCYFA